MYSNTNLTHITIIKLNNSIKTKTCYYNNKSLNNYYNIIKVNVKIIFFF